MMTIYEKIKKSALESPNPPFIPYLWSKEYQEDLKKEPEWERLGDPFSSTLKAMRFFNEKKEEKNE